MVSCKQFPYARENNSIFSWKMTGEDHCFQLQPLVGVQPSPTARKRNRRLLYAGYPWRQIRKQP